MTVPAIPSLPAGHVVTLAELQAVAYAATFLLTKPIVYAIQVANPQAIGTGSTTFNNWSGAGIIYDTDGMWNSANTSRFTVQTPGWFKIRYGLNTGTVGGTITTSIKSTTGPNNPQGSGIASSKYWGGYADVTATSLPGYAGASGVWPQYMYAGDYFQVLMQAAASGSSTGLTGPTGTTLAGSFFTAEYVSA